MILLDDTLFTVKKFDLTKEQNICVAIHWKTQIMEISVSSPEEAKALFEECLKVGKLDSMASFFNIVPLDEAFTLMY